MKFAIVGAGAIGAFLGAMLSRCGEDVTLVARGPHLRAMQDHGLRIRGEAGEFEVRPKATDDLTSVGPVDVVIITLKAQSLPAIAPQLHPLLGPDTSVVTAQNGFPWWYFHGLHGEWQGMHVEAVDPDGTISRHIDAARVIVLLSLDGVIEPGVVWHIEGTRFAIGEPDGSKSERVGARGRVHQSRSALSDSQRHPPRHLGQADGQRCLQSHQCLDPRDLNRNCAMPGDA
jgi:2-dehydropantoate 2-reductase